MHLQVTSNQEQGADYLVEVLLHLINQQDVVFSVVEVLKNNLQVVVYSEVVQLLLEEELV